MAQQLGNRIKDFLFEAPTESTIGIAPSKEHMTKEQAIEAIQKSWDDPFGMKDTSAAGTSSAGASPGEAPVDSRTLGEKIKDFLFEEPTEATMKDFPAPKEHFTKDMAIAAIQKSWEHPLKNV